MSDGYDKFLEEIHSKNFTTDDVISAIVQEATGSKIISKKRIMAGEVNEVYDIELQDGESVIVRIHESSDPAFLSEKWAIDQCKLVGVPVPTVLLVKHIPAGDKTLSFCVQEKLRGDTVERGKINMWNIDKEQLRAIMNKAGELLTRMQTISVSGFGSLDDHGKGQNISFVEKLTGESKRWKYMEVAAELNLEQQFLKAIDLINHLAPKYKSIQQTFNHGDFAPKHIMYEGREVSGILDFGDIESHAPIYDFARWEYWYGDTDILKWLKEGFTDKSIFNEDYDELSNLIQLNVAMGTIWHYHKNQNYLEGVKNGAKKLDEILSRFN
ncbi:MAG: aminoglycoside phosphotransferase family protein [Nanoarchaeota archaeon]|nr:aminoglycoside phosphotransferase family protein [Nanoarchaeota archaeon]